MLPFKEMVKTREKTDLQNLGVNQEFSFGYIQTEMSVIDPRGTIDKQAAGYLSLKLGGGVRVEAVIVGLRLLHVKNHQQLPIFQLG